jgi:hypothetical protein
MCGIGRVPNWKTILVQKLPLSSFIAPLGGRKGHGTPSTFMRLSSVVHDSSRSEKLVELLVNNSKFGSFRVNNYTNAS